MIRFIAVAVATSVLVAACSKTDPEPATAQSPTPAAPGAKVTQVIQTAMYTYAEVEIGTGAKGWIAGSRIDVKEGDRVEWRGASVMRNFRAASINRTFDEILFVNAWAKAGTTPVQTAAHGVLPPPPTAAAGDASGTGVVKSAAHGGGYSYVEVDSNGRTLWVAVPQTTVKTGDSFDWHGGNEMRNFSAPSLGRRFDRLILATSGRAGG